MADWIIREIRAFGTGEKEKGEEEEEALQLATTISVEHFESTDTGMCIGLYRYVCRSNFSVGSMYFGQDVLCCRMQQVESFSPHSQS